MKHILVSTVLFIAFCAPVSAQITLSGKIANLPTNARQAALESWNTDRWQQVAVIKFDPGGAFSQSLASPPVGQCRLRVWSEAKKWSDFILPETVPAGANLVFDLDFNSMDGGPARVSGSPDNEWYFTLMSARRALDQLRDSSSTASPAQVDAALQAFNRLCRDMAAQHKGSFTGDVVANLLYEPQRADYPADPQVASMNANAFAIAHALDPVPFRRWQALYHNGFVKALNRYYNYFDRKNGDGKDYVDKVMASRAGNEEVDGFLFRFLLDKLMDYKDEAGLAHLLKWYLPDCTDENPLPNGLQNLLGALQACAPGNTVPNLQLPGPDGQTAALSDVCAKNKITLLLFWRSTCSHCQEFEPILADLYEKYHPLGVEVYALSTDKTEADWKTFLQVHPTKWVNVFVPQDQRGDLSRNFPAPSTPTLISIDSNRKVLSRLIARSALEAYLKETLAKLKEDSGKVH